MDKYKPTGIYIPEFVILKQIAAIESGKTQKPATGGGLLRKITQDFIRRWQKKNPGSRLTV